MIQTLALIACRATFISSMLSHLYLVCSLSSIQAQTFLMDDRSGKFAGHLRKRPELRLELARLIYPAHTKDTKAVECLFEYASLIPCDMLTHAGMTVGESSMHFTVQHCKSPEQDLWSPLYYSPIGFNSAVSHINSCQETFWEY